MTHRITQISYSQLSGKKISCRSKGLIHVLHQPLHKKTTGRQNQRYDLTMQNRNISASVQNDLIYQLEYAVTKGWSTVYEEMEMNNVHELKLQYFLRCNNYILHQNHFIISLFHGIDSCEIYARVHNLTVSLLYMHDLTLNQKLLIGFHKQASKIQSVLAFCVSISYFNSYNLMPAQKN